MHEAVDDEHDQLKATLDAAAREHETARLLGETKLPEYTENEVARRFARQASDSFIYNHSSRNWYLWDRSAWLVDRKSAAIEWVRRFIETQREAAIDPRERAAMGRVRFVNAVEEISRSDPLLAVDQGSLDTDPWLLGTPEGVVDLHTGFLQSGRQTDLITRRTAVTPAHPGTPSMMWEAFLKEATREDC